MGGNAGAKGKLMKAGISGNREDNMNEHDKINIEHTNLMNHLNHQWYDSAIFYHIYTFALTRAPFENDYGDVAHKLSEIEKWIPHIKDLGCDAVLLSPVLKSRSHGYDVTDYFQIDNRIGTNDEFKALVGRFHENGLRVVLDSVFNHCGRDFFAFKELQGGNADYAEWFAGVDFSRQSRWATPSLTTHGAGILSWSSLI